jgi:aromatic ring-cleaving dioxygenase
MAVSAPRSVTEIASYHAHVYYGPSATRQVAAPPLKIEKPEPMTLIEKIKAEIKKRAEAKAKGMLLRRPRRLTKRYG